MTRSAEPKHHAFPQPEHHPELRKAHQGFADACCQHASSPAEPGRPPRSHGGAAVDETSRPPNTENLPGESSDDGDDGSRGRIEADRVRCFLVHRRGHRARGDSSSDNCTALASWRDCYASRDSRRDISDTGATRDTSTSAGFGTPKGHIEE